MSLLCSLLFYDRVERREEPADEFLPEELAEELAPIDFNSLIFDALSRDTVAVLTVPSPANPFPRRYRRRRRRSDETGVVDAINDFTRTRMREEGFYRRILPPIAISNDELDRAVPTDRPILVVDRMAELPMDALE